MLTGISYHNKTRLNWPSNEFTIAVCLIILLSQFICLLFLGAETCLGDIYRKNITVTLATKYKLEAIIIFVYLEAVLQIIQHFHKLNNTPIKKDLYEWVI